MINDRRKKVLQAIVEEYIKTAIPISSNSLITKEELKYSSATIRNEMAELEKNGLLKKTHTSSGRVPSKQGYKYYVTELLNNIDILSSDEVKYITNVMQSKINDLDNLGKITAQIISEVTHYATITLENDLKSELVKEVKFVQLSENLLLVILITQNNIIKETIINYDVQMPDELINYLTYLFNDKMVGKPICEINFPLDEMLMKDTKDFTQFLIPIIENLKYEIMKKNNIHFEAADNLLSYPEFDDIENTKKLIEILSKKEILDNAIAKIDDDDKLKNTLSNIKVVIGDENSNDFLDNMSIITYQNDKTNETIGIIRPKRMDYAKVISVIEYINKMLDE